MAKLGQFDDLKSADSDASQIVIGWTCKPTADFRSAGMRPAGARRARAVYGRGGHVISSVSCEIGFDTEDSGPLREVTQIQPRLFSSGVSAVARDRDGSDRRCSITVRRATSSDTTSKHQWTEATEADDNLVRTSLQHEVGLDESSLDEIKEDFVSAETIGCVLRHFLPERLALGVDLVPEIARFIVNALVGDGPRGMPRRPFVERDAVVPTQIVEYVREIARKIDATELNRALEGDLGQPNLFGDTAVSLGTFLDVFRRIPARSRMEFRRQLADDEGFEELVRSAIQEELGEKLDVIFYPPPDEQVDRTRRVDGLLDTIASAIPKEGTRHDDWFHFAKTWAELVALVLESDAALAEPARQKMESLQTQIDAALMSWLKKRYAGLVNLPPVPPVMLHHIPRFLSRHIGDAKEHKVVFVLVDGLSLDQWIVIRKELAGQHARYRFREHAVFAWIPTITSVSRQAAFAGKAPIYFPNSIHTTDKEPALWMQFWVDQGLTQQEVAYAKGLGDGKLDSVEEIIARPKMRVVGLVVDKIDKIMHGMELGTAGMHNQVRQWAGQPFMANLLDLLLEGGFRVYLSSDHGSIEAAGCGRPAEGAVADVRGERARIYPDPLLRGQVKERFPDALEWPSVGLPEGYLPLLAPGRLAFVRKTERLVGHGGACLEEIVVPLVEIERRDM